MNTSPHYSRILWSVTLLGLLIACFGPVFPESTWAETVEQQEKVTILLPDGTYIELTGSEVLRKKPHEDAVPIPLIESPIHSRQPTVF